MAVGMKCSWSLLGVFQNDNSIRAKGREKMKDPYEILGVSPNASDDEIKQAYRMLAKKYHPDKYANSPLAESASEKMKEINSAYDRILNDRKHAGRERRSSGYSSGYSDSTRSHYNNIRMMINSGKFSAAEQELSVVPSNERDAEWYYLMGVVVYHNGWLEDAYNYFQTACRMDPNNVEYRSMFNRIRQQRSGAQGGYNTSSAASESCSCCDICTCLMCSDCLCSCCRS